MAEIHKVTYYKEYDKEVTVELDDVEFKIYNDILKCAMFSGCGCCLDVEEDIERKVNAVKRISKEIK